MAKIRIAKIEDIPEVHRIERKIIGVNADYISTLKGRLQMFPNGFRVAEKKKNIIGYVESCIWNLDDFNTFNEIRGFYRHYDENGRNLYIIHLAVDKDHRRNGIGSELIENLRKYSEERRLEEIQLVAEDKLINFYEKLGFKVTKRLPYFLSRSGGNLMKSRISQSKN